MKSCHNDNESHSRSVSLFLLIRSYDLGNPQRPVKYDKQVVVEQDEGVQGVKEKATEVELTVKRKHFSSQVIHVILKYLLVLPFPAEQKQSELKDKAN